MIETGAHVRVVQQRLGHASIRKTFDVYGPIVPAADEAVTAGLVACSTSHVSGACRGWLTDRVG